MISKIATPEYINRIYYKNIRKVSKKKTQISNLNHYVRDELLGYVTFTTNKNDEFIQVHLKDCKFGYIFIIKTTCDKEDECCVCKSYRTYDILWT